MSAYLVGQISVKDPEQWKLYVEGVRASLEPYDAEVVFRGRRAVVLAGDQPRELVVVIRFADRATLEDWHGSGAYQALVPIRERAADVIITGYEELP